MTPAQPSHPLPALTTYELTVYRRDLEHALTAIPGTDPARALLRTRLCEVIAEQQSRARLRDTGAR